jgi:hypothetical protein
MNLTTLILNVVNIYQSLDKLFKEIIILNII